MDISKHLDIKYCKEFKSKEISYINNLPFGAIVDFIPNSTTKQIEIGVFADASSIDSSLKTNFV
jgi:hypothetical protein